MRELARRIDWFQERVGRVVSWLMLGMVVVVFTDVVLRYLFSQSSVFAQELEWHLFGLVYLLAGGYTMLYNEHVRVDILYEKYRPATRARVDLAVAAVTLAVAGVIFALSLTQVEHAYVSGEGSTDPGGLPYRFLLKAFIPLGFVLVILQAVAQAARSVHAIIAGGRGG